MQIGPPLFPSKMGQSATRNVECSFSSHPESARSPCGQYPRGGTRATRYQRKVQGKWPLHFHGRSRSAYVLRCRAPQRSWRDHLGQGLERQKSTLRRTATARKGIVARAFGLELRLSHGVVLLGFAAPRSLTASRRATPTSNHFQHRQRDISHPSSGVRPVVETSAESFLVATPISQVWFCDWLFPTATDEGTVQIGPPLFPSKMGQSTRNVECSFSSHPRICASTPALTNGKFRENGFSASSALKPRGNPTESTSSPSCKPFSLTPSLPIAVFSQAHAE